MGESTTPTTFVRQSGSLAATRLSLIYRVALNLDCVVLLKENDLDITTTVEKAFKLDGFETFLYDVSGELDFTSRNSPKRLIWSDGIDIKRTP